MPTSMAASSVEPTSAEPRQHRGPGPKQLAAPARQRENVCLADNCSELAPSRDTVCATHRVANDFVCVGIVSRFCNQCVRVHKLDQFEGKRRVCAARFYRRRRRREAKKATAAVNAPASPPSPNIKDSKPTRHHYPSSSATSACPSFEDLHEELPFPNDLDEVPNPELWFPKPYAAPSTATESWSFAATSKRLFHTATNVTMKMFNMTPADLDPALLGHLKFLMEAAPNGIQGAMRPGCVVLSVDMWFRNQIDAEAAHRALEQHLHSKGGPIWGQGTAELYFVDVQQKMQGAHMVSSKPRTGPTILAAGPIVSNPGLSDWHLVVAKGPEAVTSRHVVCRVKGHFYEATVLGEHELQDGNVCITLRPPMQDAALGLAWVEVVERLANGRDELISQSYPMFLTTRCDICDEMSSLFSEASPAQSRDMAGVLKALEDVFHPMDEEAVLQPEDAAALALLCARHGFHKTLEEIMDEMDYRSPAGSFAQLVQIGKAMIPGGFAACASASRCPVTIDLVMHDIVGHRRTSDDTSCASSQTQLVAPEDWQEDEISSASPVPPKHEPRAITLLKHPATAAATLTCAALAYSFLPWNLTWKAVHTLYTAALLHIVVPGLYHFVYAPAAKNVASLAASLGVTLTPSGLSPADPVVHQLLDAHVLVRLKSWECRFMFYLWLVWATVAGQLHGYLNDSPEVYTVCGNTLLVCVHLAILAAREFALRKEAVLWAQRIQPLPFVLCNIYWCANGVHAWLADIPPYSAPACFETEGSLIPLAAMLVVKLIMCTMLALVLSPPISELAAYRLALSAPCILGGYMLSSMQPAYHPRAMPHLWISWTLLELSWATVFVTTRLWLQTTWLATALRRYAAKNK